MTRAIAICSSIEAEKIELKTRKFDSSPPIIEKATRKMIYKFQLGINSSAAISQPYASPETSVKYETSMTASGDEPTVGCIDGWTYSPPKAAVGKGSGAHSATFVAIKGGCYAHIQTPAREHLNDPDMDAKTAPVKQMLRMEG